MSSGDIKELNRRDANNQWSVKMFVVNGEEQWWVENGERNIALCMSREDAEHIVEAHNKFRGLMRSDFQKARAIVGSFMDVSF